VHQLARTLKTCRLYDRNNPTVVRFREDLAASLVRTLADHGSMKLKFTSSDVLLGEASLYAARSHDDNLALPFFRDGVRSLTFSPGIESGEVEALLDRLLRVTSRESGDEDLVTLLWDAHLTHVDVEYVSTDGDVEGGSGGDEAPPDEAPVAPWPARRPETGSAALAIPAESGTPATTRSDDRATGMVPGDLDVEFGKLDAEAQGLTGRFQREFRSEYDSTIVSATLALVRECLDSGAGVHDSIELARFLPRVLHEAIGLGLWTDACDALQLLRRCESPEWSIEALAQELVLSASVTTSGAVAQLDQQDAKGGEEFLAFARELGAPGADWLMRVLAESQQQRARRPLAKTVAEVIHDNPERLAPWLSDGRWYVVRNVVHILGWIGGAEIAGLLGVAARHPEPRVRQEVVAALAQVPLELARPILLELMESCGSRLFCAALHQLSAAREPGVARRLLGYAQVPNFGERPLEEKHAIYSALAATATDELLPGLELELHKGNWLSRGLDQHRHAIARCIGRVGTAAARVALEQGARSRRAQVRQACEDALAGFHPNA